MRTTLMVGAAAAALLFAAPAYANVVLADKLSGTGDNVVFDSFVAGSHTAVGSFNGQHQGLVDFTDLSTTAGFTSSQSGNDIKIANTSNLKIVVMDSTNTTVQDTLEQVFSLKGSGDVTAFVTTDEPGGGTGAFSFDLGTINGAQSGFTLTATDGEAMSSLRLHDVGGTITDYEHYRIDVGTVSAVPLPGALSLFGGGIAGLALLARRKRNRTDAEVNPI